MKTIAILLALSLTAFSKPTLWIIGDSTVKNDTRNQQGWGDPLMGKFDTERITVVNKAIGGRSSRSFRTEGRWEEVMDVLKPGDYVLLQFGHNDGGEYFKGDRPRASIKGIGEETETGTVELTGKEETVHSFGWYMRTYAAEAISKGATPIIVSLIPRNMRDKAGRTIPSEKDYALWAQQSAAQSDAYFIPFNALLCAEYDKLGVEKADLLFDKPDHTHTRREGAEFNAGILARAIRSLPACDLKKFLLP